MRINLVVAPYRDAYFYKKYGAAVRDLQFVETLESMADIEQITIINRPVTLLEKCLLRKPLRCRIETSKIKTVDLRSWDLLGPLKGRAWASEIYPEVLERVLKNQYKEGMLNIFLDFLPIGIVPKSALKDWLYWYDYIDNFRKHNRFSEAERDLVGKKYDYVAEHANCVTYVSESCMAANGARKSTVSAVVTNKVFWPRKTDPETVNVGSAEIFDLGFVGFITDKLDVEFIRKIPSKYSIVVYGHSYDAAIKRRLQAMSNVKMKGSFSFNDLPQIISSFRIGLIPYRSEKSHDGSPLKLYEYIKHNRPCLTSINYEINAENFIINYNEIDDIETAIERLKPLCGNSSISGAIRDDWRLDRCLERIVSRLLAA